jgi:hypothetical protein
VTDFNESLNKALRYAAEDAQNLLSQMAANPEHLHTHDSVLRLVAADALDEVGRSDEAKYLRQRRPVAIRGGEVVPQNYTKEHVRRSELNLRHALNRATDWEFNEASIPLTYSHHKITSEQTSAPPTEEDHKNNNYSALSHWNGWLESFDRSLPLHADDPNAEVLHYTQYPEWLANKYREALNEGGHWDGMTPEDRDAVLSRLHELSQSPVTKDEEYPDNYEQSFLKPLG